MLIDNPCGPKNATAPPARAARATTSRRANKDKHGHITANTLASTTHTFFGASMKQKQLLASYVTAFLGNFAVIGFGLWLFEGRHGAAALSIIALMAGAFIAWRAS